MFITNVVDPGATRTFKVSSLKSGAHTAATFSEGAITTAGASSVAFGLIINDDPEAATVQLSGQGLWQAGEDISAGDLLSSGEDGKAVKAQSGSFILARALEGASQGELACVQIINAGRA